MPYKCEYNDGRHLSYKSTKNSITNFREIMQGVSLVGVKIASLTFTKKPKGS